MGIGEAVEDLERRMIQRALDEHKGVAAHAAEALGITKSNLAYKMKKYGLGYLRRPPAPRYFFSSGFCTWSCWPKPSCITWSQSLQPSG